MQYYTLINKNMLNALIKLLDWRKTTHNYRVMGGVWVLYKIHKSYFAGNPYTACIMVTITPI